MKALVLSILTGSLLVTSATAIADDLITITGEPITIQQEGDVYVPTSNVMPDQDYYYFTVDGSKRVCYREVRPQLADLTVHPFQVRVGGNVVTMQCYDYNPKYFVIQ